MKSDKTLPEKLSRVDWFRHYPRMDLSRFGIDYEGRYTPAPLSNLPPGAQTPSGGVVAGNQQEVSFNDVVEGISGITGIVLEILGTAVTIRTAENQTAVVEAPDITNVYQQMPATDNGNDWEDWALPGAALIGLLGLAFLIARR